MINASDAFKQKLQDGEKVWQEVEITFPDSTVKTVKDEIMGENCTYSDCAESSSFPIGCVVCKSMTLELDNTSDQWKNYNFYMAKVHAYIKMQTSVASPAVTDELLDENYDPILDQSGEAILAAKAATEDRIETIDKGIYTITTPEQYGELLSFTALDNMYKANATYTSKLVLPQTIINLVRDACDTLNIPFGGTMQHGNLIVSEIPENMTFRQLFGWAAMIETANARLDNKGYLQFIKWDFSNLQEDCSAVVDADGNVRFKGGASIDSENFISPAGNWTIDNDGFLTLIESAADTSEKLKDFFESPTVSSDDIAITGVKLKNKENESVYGNTGYVLELENDLVSDADLDTTAAQIGDSIIGVKFRSMLGELAYNPLIEFGDMAYTYDRKWNRYITPLTDVSCSVNGKTTVKTQADDPIRGQSKFQSEATKAIVEARRLVKKEKSAREKAVERLEETLKNSSGLYETSVTQEDDSTITYLHDKPTLAESKNVIKFTAEAIGVSNDGGETYPYGFFLTGDLIAKILYAHGINADYIDTGALTVKDKNGDIIFQVNMDTNTVYMNPDILTIGNMTLSKKLESMDENIASAKNMTFQLTNDMQTITSDADGNIPVFPTVTTTAKVMYGSSDITNDCSYTVTKSDSVTGSWDVDTHTYTVTGLSADNGWVDIKATYLINLSATKRFTLAKQKQGLEGDKGLPGKSPTIRYASMPDGSDMSDNPKYVKLLDSAGNVISDSTGDTIYTSGEAIYVGFLKASAEVDSANPSDYEWSRYKGTDGLTQYTHLAYANSADGKTDFSVDSPNREYIGMYVDFTESDSTNPDDYAWSLIKGKDGADGTPGKPGADGKTPYFHVAYANSEDGNTGFSVDDSTNKLYIGQYTDYEVKDSTDPAKYSWTKIKGNDGTPGRTYYLRANTEILLMGQDKKVSPEKLTVNAYYRDGQGEETAFAGWWKAERSSDSGKTWTTITLNQTEATGACTITSSLQIIGSRGMIKVTCYLDQAKTSIADMQTYSVALDVAALTQKQIVEILSDDGKWKGLYYNNGNLYISFSAAMGGSLTLGGKNNGDGTLTVRDANNNQIGKWDNTGADITGKIKTITSEGTYINMTGQAIDFMDDIHSSKKSILRIFAGLQGGDTTYSSTASLDLGDNTDFSIAGNSWAMLQMYPDDNHTTKIMGNFEVIYGTKSRVAETKSFSDRLLYCYETPTPLFGDLGCGKTNDEGISIIDIDPIFSETISSDAEYQVFLQKEGPGDIWIDTKESEYFIVKGTPNLKFSWEIKCLQRNFEHLRLNEDTQSTMVSRDIVSAENDLNNIIDGIATDYDKEMEELINESS